MILCVMSESIRTAVLSSVYSLHDKPDPSPLRAAANAPQDYVDRQKPPLSTLAIGSFITLVGIFVATIFSAAFFDLFWPAHHKSHAVKTTWKICSIVAWALRLACAITYTYVIAAESAWAARPDGIRAGREAARCELAAYGGIPLEYSRNARAATSVVLRGVGWCARLRGK
jgi:hypothetical protein